MKKIVYVVIAMMTLMVTFSCGNQTAKGTDADTTVIDSVQGDTVDTVAVDTTVCPD